MHSHHAATHPAEPSPADRTPAGAGLSRRGLLAAAAGVALSGAGFASPARAAAAATGSPYFDLRTSSSPVLLGVRLHEAHRIMQSFAFDNVNARLFVAQAQNSSSGDDLCISELDLQGNLVGWMHLDSVGHGVSIGVEAVGSRSYLWTESRSSASDGSGRGTALQRFEFVSGQKPSDVRTFLTGSDNITCAVDQLSSRLLLRRRVKGRMEVSVHDLAAAARGDFADPLARTWLSGIPGVFQGYTLHGDVAYVLSGQGHADPGDIDSRLTSFDLRTGRRVQSGVLTRAGASLRWREPEGMAVQRRADGQVRLCFGLASHDPRVPGVRLANIFTKGVLVG